MYSMCWTLFLGEGRPSWFSSKVNLCTTVSNKIQVNGERKTKFKNKNYYIYYNKNHRHTLQMCTCLCTHKRTKTKERLLIIHKNTIH